MPEFRLPHEHSIDSQKIKDPPKETALSAGAVRAIEAAGQLAGGACAMTVLQAVGELVTWPWKDAWDGQSGFVLEFDGPDLIARLCEAFDFPIKSPAPVFEDFLPKAAEVKAVTAGGAMFDAGKMVYHKPTKRACEVVELASSLEVRVKWETNHVSVHKTAEFRACKPAEALAYSDAKVDKGENDDSFDNPHGDDVD